GAGRGPAPVKESLPGEPAERAPASCVRRCSGEDRQSSGSKSRKRLARWCWWCRWFFPWRLSHSLILPRRACPANTLMTAYAKSFISSALPRRARSRQAIQRAHESFEVVDLDLMATIRDMAHVDVGNQLLDFRLFLGADHVAVFRNDERRGYRDVRQVGVNVVLVKTPARDHGGAF